MLGAIKNVGMDTETKPATSAPKPVAKPKGTSAPVVKVAPKVAPKPAPSKRVEVTKEVQTKETAQVTKEVQTQETAQVTKEVQTKEATQVTKEVQTKEAGQVTKELKPESNEAKSESNEAKSESNEAKLECKLSNEVEPAAQLKHDLIQADPNSSIIPASPDEVANTGNQEEKEVGPVAPTLLIKTTWVLDRGTRPSRVQLLKKLCLENGLTWDSATKHVAHVEGQAKDFAKVLECTFTEYAFPDRANGIRANNVHPLKNVGHIFGLDTCTVPKHTNSFQPREILPRASTFTPLQVAEIYQFPSGDGAGQKVGIVSLGGGYYLSDIKTYLESLGVSVENLAHRLVDVPVDGATNSPGSNAGADMENALDIEIIAALCPAAEIRVYFAPNGNSGFYNAFLTAFQDGCGVISCSWGARESQFGASALDSFNALFQAIAQAGGTTIFAASGDTGSSDGGSGNNVDFPASSPFVVGCGGTTLTASGTNIESEIVWNVNPTTSATGGGLSAHFAVPSYQSNNSAYPFNGLRGVPDVAGNANPNTGYQLYTTANGTHYVGGTSAVSPLWSALMVRVKQIVKSQGLPDLGFIHPVIYQATTTAFNDILVGNNGNYTAVAEWDACTGNGSPIGTKILALFASPTVVTASFTSSPSIGETPLTVQFTDTSTGSPTIWLWDFGDGTTSDLQHPSHIFVNPDANTEKSFTVTLTVDGTSTDSHTIKVTNNIQNNAALAGWAIALIVLAVLAVVVLIGYFSYSWSGPRMRSRSYTING